MACQRGLAPSRSAAIQSPANQLANVRIRIICCRIKRRNGIRVADFAQSRSRFGCPPGVDRLEGWIVGALPAPGGG